VKKTLVVLSGGMDSAVALAMMVRDYGPDGCHAVTFNYGSKHNARENQAARLLAEHYKVNHTLIELPFVNQLFKSDLLQSGGDIPEGHYADPSMKRTVVPFRNGIMLSIAAGLAESLEAELLVIGNHAGDHAIYPDCRQAFIGPMGAAIEEGTYARVQLVSPFCWWTKGQIALVGARIQVPFEKTYSCYNGREKHCGKCGTCVERIEAFATADVVDPTEYEPACGAL
jgi:7-cyano-7-deazaguanine synthase